MDLSNMQAEGGIIASFIYHPEFISHFDHLRPKCFSDEGNQCIVWALQELSKKGIDNIDAFNIDTALSSNPAVFRKMKEYNIKSIQEFIDLGKYTARNTVQEVKPLVDEVVTLSFKRDMANTLKQLEKSCYNPDTSLRDLDKIVTDRLNGLTEKYLVVDDIEHLGKKVDDIWDSIVRERNPDGTFGIPSKFPHVNDYFTYSPGELVVIAGRLKSGKSQFFMNEAVDKLKKGIGVVYFDSEMSDKLFLIRMITNVSGVSINKVMSGKCSKDEEDKILKAKEWVKKQNLTHIYMPVVNLDSMYSTVKLLQAKDNIGLVIYDYIKSYEGESAAMISALIGKITDYLKNRIAGELNIPVLAGSQLSRDMQIADSDKLARVASTVAIWRQKQVEEVAKDGLECGNYCLKILYNRNGEQMDEDEYIDFMFEPNIMTVTEAKRQHTVQSLPFKEE